MDKVTLIGIIILGVGAIGTVIAIAPAAEAAYVKYYDFEYPYEHHDDIAVLYWHHGRYYNDHDTKDTDYLGQYVRVFNPDNKTLTYANVNVTAIRDGPWSIMPSDSHLRAAINNTDVGNILLDGKIVGVWGYEAIDDRELFLFEWQRDQIEALQQDIQGMKQTIIDLEYDIAKLQKQN